MNMAQNLLDQWWVLDAGNHSELATAFWASLDVDGEDAFEPLHPTHGRHGLVTFHGTLRSLRYDAITMLEIGRKYTVETSQIHAWAWNQCRQAGNEVQRFQHDMGRSIPEGMFVAVNDTAPAINTEAFGGDRRAGDVAAQTFQA